ncbi:MAG: hypothetical protein KDA87_27820, partial [Planctomycetales bacterium]|nr:hypothetical protein [Planctomycetales bacterium]
MNIYLLPNTLSVTFAGQELSHTGGFYQQAWLATITTDGQVQRMQRIGSYRWLGNFGSGSSGITVEVDDTPNNPADWRIILATSAGGRVYLGDASTVAEETQIGEPADDLKSGLRFSAAKESMVNAGLLVMSFSTHGQLVWYRLFQGAGRQSVTEMMVDEQGEIYVNG